MTEVFRMPTSTGNGIELKRYEDVIFPNLDIGDPVWAVNYAKAFEYKPGDIIMCTYPKCGTHWIGNTIWKLKELDTSKRTDTMIEFGPPEYYDTMETPRIIYTHLKPNRLPTEHIQNGGKILLLLRNPKDAMVSYYYHLKNATLFSNKQTWDEYFQSYIDGLVPFGSYFDYVQQWDQFIKEKQMDVPIQVFYYEDFKIDYKDNFARLTKFADFNRDDKYLERVSKETTMSALKEQDASGKRETNALVRDQNGDSVIYRKGEVGDWKNHLTVAQSEIVDNLMKEKLKYGMIKIKYEI